MILVHFNIDLSEIYSSCDGRGTWIYKHLIDWLIDFYSTSFQHTIYNINKGLITDQN